MAKYLAREQVQSSLWLIYIAAHRLSASESARCVPRVRTAIGPGSHMLGLLTTKVDNLHGN